MTATQTPLQEQIANARALRDDLIRRSEDRLLARRPIDHDLEVEICRAEDDLSAVLRMAPFPAPVATPRMRLAA